MRQFDRRTSALSEPKHHVGITSSPVEETGIGVGGGSVKKQGNAWVLLIPL